MKIPDIDCKIDMFGPINLSEEPSKIRTALTNIFPNSALKTENFSVHATSSDLTSLEKIHEIIHSKQSQKTYRRNLEKNLEDDSTWFYLNKQAAFAGKIVICEEAQESPLGPIRVVLTSSNIDKVVDWMVSRDNET